MVECITKFQKQNNIIRTRKVSSHVFIDAENQIVFNRFSVV